MDKEDKKIKHLEMIETVIERIGNNSFQLKGWSVTLVSIIGALSAQGSEKKFFLLAFIPLLAFWMLDAFYLQIERKYRVLYKQVLDDKITTFDMDIHDINTNDDKNIGFLRCMFAQVEGWFYLSIIGVVMTLAILIGVFH
ncbi:hypothetical protein JRC49_14750 [Clostridiales bacterium FE2011]|nr:hypothetical protein JRC49_14750 [Clostridiales bacterium FE2011]